MVVKSWLCALSLIIYPSSQESLFNFLGPVSEHCPGFINTHPTEAGRGVLSFIFSVVAGWIKRTVEFHIICYLVGNLCNGHAFIATDVEDAIRRMFY